jgi:uncharacterized protein (DUF433 family)
MAQSAKSKQTNEDVESIVLVIHKDSVPLRADVGGAVRVGPTRVTLDTVIGTFEDGASAEEIVNKYPALRLADVYLVIGYYLRHQAEIRAYLQMREEEAEQLRQEIESRWPSNGLRERLLVRLAERQESAQQR